MNPQISQLVSKLELTRTIVSVPNDLIEEVKKKIESDFINAKYEYFNVGKTFHVKRSNKWRRKSAPVQASMFNTINPARA